VLTVPIVLIELFFDFPGKIAPLFFLAIPVQFIVGWSFYKRAYGVLRGIDTALSNSRTPLMLPPPALYKVLYHYDQVVV